MEELIKLLENPFDDVTTKEAFQTKCEEIATKLFNDYCINCNGKKFYFAEIEFYYWQKDKWNEKWNQVTYARDGYEAGDLFFHLSGIDICFKSSYSEAKFGGILIRSIIDKNNNVISDPLNCKDVILNVCKGGCMPKLSKTENRGSIAPKGTYRSLGSTDMKNNIDGTLKLCFFNEALREQLNPEKQWFDKTKAEIKSRPGTYNTEKFYAKQN